MKLKYVIYTLIMLELITTIMTYAKPVKAIIHVEPLKTLQKEKISIKDMNFDFNFEYDDEIEKTTKDIIEKAKLSAMEQFSHLTNKDVVAVTGTMSSEEILSPRGKKKIWIDIDLKS